MLIDNVWVCVCVCVFLDINFLEYETKKCFKLAAAKELYDEQEKYGTALLAAAMGIQVAWPARPCIILSESIF